MHHERNHFSVNTLREWLGHESGVPFWDTRVRSGCPPFTAFVQGMLSTWLMRDGFYRLHVIADGLNGMETGIRT